MDIENINGYSLKNLGEINIIVGKNGCGKSTSLRVINSGLRNAEGYGKIKYISPERGGSLSYESGIDNAINTNLNYIIEQRSKNQVDNFKKQTVTLYKNLELLVLRKFEEDQKNNKFDDTINAINGLLSNVEIRRSGHPFEIFDKITNQKVSPENISSGESEILSLAIECLVFSQEHEAEKNNILLLDEPDVHLHPDLQVKFMHFLKEIIINKDTRIILSTHSTAIIGAFDDYNECRICFMQNKQTGLIFENIHDVYQKILPIFGAHPLSNIFNSFPILILEGEDDVRIWQQVVRSSQSKIRLYPCDAGSKDEISEMEGNTKRILNSVYDDAKGYSLRDKDDEPEEISDELPIIRFRLSCRNAESLILSNEAITKAGVDGGWEAVKILISNWILAEDGKTDGTPKHAHYNIIKEFRDTGFNRKDFNLKEIRNDMMYIMGSNKPWEVLVGQSIAENFHNASSLLTNEGSIFNFLGKKLVETIFTTRNL